MTQTIDKKVEENLADAKKYAQKGDTFFTNTCLSLAERYAEYIKQDITKKVTKIRASVKEK